MLWEGDEGKDYPGEARFGEKENKEVSSFIIVDGVVNTRSGLSENHGLMCITRPLQVSEITKVSVSPPAKWRHDVDFVVLHLERYSYHWPKTSPPPSQPVEVQTEVSGHPWSGAAGSRV